jgi:hypothetical protein
MTANSPICSSRTTWPWWSISAGEYWSCTWAAWWKQGRRGAWFGCPNIRTRRRWSQRCRCWIQSPTGGDRSCLAKCHRHSLRRLGARSTHDARWQRHVVERSRRRCARSRPGTGLRAIWPDRGNQSHAGGPPRCQPRTLSPGTNWESRDLESGLPRGAGLRARDAGLRTQGGHAAGRCFSPSRRGARGPVPGGLGARTVCG